MSKTILDTEWWGDLMRGIYGARKGGARIIVDAEDAATGVGKTGLAVYIARLLAKRFDYDLQQDDLTLSGQEYLERWRKQPGKEQPSVIVLDELAGAGAGDARRAMSTQNVELGRSWQLMRKKRIVSIVTLPHWSDADKKMRRFADFRLWCRNQPIGYFKPYRVTSTFDSGNVQTRGYDDVARIGFPNLEGNGDEYYAMLTEKKDDLLATSSFDADDLLEENQTRDPEEVERETKIEIAQAMRDDGMTLTSIADKLNYSVSWVGSNTENPETDDESNRKEAAA